MKRLLEKIKNWYNNDDPFKDKEGDKVAKEINKWDIEEGDIIVVRNNLSEDEPLRYGVNSEMEGCRGEELTVTSIQDDRIKVMENRWTWTVEMISDHKKPDQPEMLEIDIPAWKSI